MLSKRRSLIDEVLKDLKLLKEQSIFNNEYALDENIGFFTSIKSLPSYLLWLFKKARNIKREKLLELSDLPFTKWDEEMHLKLIEMQRKPFPGLIKPIVSKITDFILKNAQKDLLLLNLGSGAMEIERQVIYHLKEKHTNRVVFIGIDKSVAVKKLARDNFSRSTEFVEIHEIEHLNQKKLDEILEQNTGKYVVLLCKNDIFRLLQDFNPQKFDLIYHSLFKHHLNNQEKDIVDEVIKQLTVSSIEYEGYKSWLVMIPQSITTCKYPVLLNATIFSDLRYYTKKELKQKYNNRPSFFNIGTYMLENGKI